MTYSVVGNTNPGLFTALSIDSPTGRLTLDYLSSAGASATITVRATDSDGYFVETNFTVTIDTAAANCRLAPRRSS
jgi:hypothetical protein